MTMIMPWPDLLRAATLMGVLPSAFWALSVREWRALVGQSESLSVARLAELSAAFPDQDERPPLTPVPV